jgi:hypothetical protein
MTKIRPQNLAAQKDYRARGNPPNTQPVTAISNCFPGLEFDFRAIWRRMFVGIELSEYNNYVTGVDAGFEHLKDHRLLLIEDDKEKLLPTGVTTTGVVNPALADGPLASSINPNGVSFMEWSNSLARIWSMQGKPARVWFTPSLSTAEVLPPDATAGLKEATLEVRSIFEGTAAGERTAALALPLAEPGELSQGLCSPWQNDYRECACYYWAASRPDYVNVVDTAEGVTRGDNWMAKEATGTYLLDNRQDPRLWSYDDLFRDWQAHLRFVIGGSDAQDRAEREQKES